MKKIILIPAGFLLTFLIVLVLLTFLNLLLLFISTYNNQNHIPPGIIVHYIPHGIIQTLPGAVILSFMMSLFSLLLKPAKTPIPLILIMIPAFGLIAAGPIWLIPFIEKTPLPDPGTSLYLTEGEIILLDKTALYIPGETGPKMENIILLDPALEGTRMTHYGEAWVEARGEHMILDLEDRSLPVPAGNSYEQFLFRYDNFTSALLKGFGTLTRDINEMAKKPDIPYYLFILLLVLLLWTGSVFLRTTKWGFFNILIYLSLLAGFFLLYDLYQTTLSGEIGKILKNKPLLDWIPIIFLGSLNVLFFLIDLLFIKNKFWKKEEKL